MRELGLKSRIRAKKKYFGSKDNLFADNILNRDFYSELPRHKLVTDITYVKVGNKNHYLSVVLDLFNNEVISYSLSKVNDGPLVIGSIKEAFKLVDVANSCILHSDQGHQYSSTAYTLLLQNLGVTKSMSRRGNCLDNACIESFFGHLKCESIYLEKIETYEELNLLIKDYIKFYNTERIQRKLNRMTPIEYRRQYEKQKALL
jgi:putative transposase